MILSAKIKILKRSNFGQVLIFRIRSIFNILTKKFKNLAVRFPANRFTVIYSRTFKVDRCAKSGS